ncbi:hypothetical protein ACQWG3_25445, partial [Salmonella enterica subsp. enterica serovar Infantis]
PAPIQYEVATKNSCLGQGEGHLINNGHGQPQDFPPQQACPKVVAVHPQNAPYKNKQLIMDNASQPAQHKKNATKLCRQH